MECKTLNLGCNLVISQTLLICAGYIDMNYDASRLSQNHKYDIQSTKNFQASKVSRLQSMWWSGENGRGGNFFIWNGHRRPIAPPHPPQAPSESELFVCRLHKFPGEKKSELKFWSFWILPFHFCWFCKCLSSSKPMLVSKIWKDITFPYYLHCLVSHLGNGSEIHLSDDWWFLHGMCPHRPPPSEFDRVQNNVRHVYQTRWNIQIEYQRSKLNSWFIWTKNLIPSLHTLESIWFCLVIL